MPCDRNKVDQDSGNKLPSDTYAHARCLFNRSKFYRKENWYVVYLSFVFKFHMLCFSECRHVVSTHACKCQSNIFFLSHRAFQNVGIWFLFWWTTPYICMLFTGYLLTTGICCGRWTTITRQILTFIHKYIPDMLWILTIHLQQAKYHVNP